MSTPRTHLQMREMADSWLRADGGPPITRETAHNETTMALDVLDLLEEVQQLQDALGLETAKHAETIKRLEEEKAVSRNLDEQLRSM